jgi:hypothetical protein
MNAVLDQLSNCDPSISQEVVFQGRGKHVGESRKDKFFSCFITVAISVEGAILFIVHVYHVCHDDDVSAK